METTVRIFCQMGLYKFLEKKPEKRNTSEGISFFQRNFHWKTVPSVLPLKQPILLCKKKALVEFGFYGTSKRTYHRVMSIHQRKLSIPQKQVYSLSLLHHDPVAHLSLLNEGYNFCHHLPRIEVPWILWECLQDPDFEWNAVLVHLSKITTRKWKYWYCHVD